MLSELGSVELHNAYCYFSAGKYKALYEYTNDDPENLDLSPGDVVDVTETPNTGWWKGRVGTREGWFPASYVQEISGKKLFIYMYFIEPHFPLLKVLPDDNIWML